MSRLLVVVDMQKDFVDGALGTKEAQAIVPAVKRKIEEYQAAGDPVVFTMDTHGPDYLATQEGKKLPVPHCIKGTPGWELAEELRESAGKMFEKGTFGGTCGIVYGYLRDFQCASHQGILSGAAGAGGRCLLRRGYAPEP